MELIRKETYGVKRYVTIQVFGDFLDSEAPEFTWVIDFNGKKVEWKTCEENCGDFVFDSEDDAWNAALDYIADHYVEYMNRKENRNDLDLERELYLNEMENPEDNIEEVPEDFRMNKVN